jgi:hypothetical protein
MGTRPTVERKPPKEQTPTNLIELPLEVDAGQAARLRAHLEAGRQFYNAVLSAGQGRLRHMRADPDWQNGYLLWHDDRLATRIDWQDAVVAHALAQPVKYARLVRRQASSPHARGADRKSERYCVQLVLKGQPYHKPKHTAGSDTVGLDLGPSSIAIVPRQGEARLEQLCAANPEHYDERGRPKKRGKGSAPWKQSRSYQVTRRRKASGEHKLAAHRKSLHGQMAHQIVALGHTIIAEDIAYKGWHRRYGRSMGLRAPGMLMDQLKRTVASTGGTLHEVPTRSSKLSQWCHGCGAFVSKPLSQRFHQCLCGIGPVQRDLYSAFLAAYLDLADPIPSCARYTAYWEGAGVGVGEHGGGAPAGSRRASHTTRRLGGRSCLCPHGCALCRSASAQKSEQSDTRAAFSLQERTSGSVKAPLRTPRA